MKTQVSEMSNLNDIYTEEWISKSVLQMCNLMEGQTSWRVFMKVKGKFKQSKNVI